MHGLIVETSICYWQDQPGRGASTRSRSCLESGEGWRGAGRPESRGSQGEGGVARTHSPGQETRPPPSRTTAGTPNRAHTLDPRGSQRTTATAQRAEKGEEEGGRAPSPSAPAPHLKPAHPGGASPQPHHGRPMHALGVRLSQPPQKGKGCWPARTRQPAHGGQNRGPTRARASAPEQGSAAWRGRGRSWDLPLVQHATGAIDRRQQNGQKIGTRGRPGSETHWGTARENSRR